MADDNASSEKLVLGTTSATMLSCATVKSSMPFCRSRMLRKKSRESSLTGLTVRAGASGGPRGE